MQELKPCSCGDDEQKCDFYPEKREITNKRPSNADRIRAMSDEELAEWHKKMMEGYCPRPTSECPNDCYACWLDWLKSPLEVEG